MSLEEFVMPRRVFNDDKTGREVWQVTDGKFECVPPYMHSCTWNDDDRYLVFMCNRSGVWQPYALELASGRARQLCDAGQAGFYSVSVDPVRNEAYCFDHRRVIGVELDSLAQRVVADFSEHLDSSDKGGRRPVISGDGRFVLTPLRVTDGVSSLLVAATDGSNEIEVVELLPENVIAPGGGKPQSDLFVLPGHEQFCPSDSNIVSLQNAQDRQNVSDEQPARRVREWRVRRDTGEITPLVYMPPGLRGTHCIWGRSGERFYFHRKIVPVWVPTALCSVNADGEDLRVYYETSEHKLGHCGASPDEQWLVTDSQDDAENMLMLVHLARDEQHLLCWPNASINSDRPDKRSGDLPPHKHRHPHPAFSRTGRYVHYGSDISGRTHVYVLDVGDLVGVVQE